MPLSSSISLRVPSRRPGLTLPLLFGTVALLLLLSPGGSTFADSATWKTNPATGGWNHAANWTPPTIPNGPLDTATFASSNTRGVSISANTEVNGIVFGAGASAFTITTTPRLTLTISGVGLTNNSGIAQNFVTGSAGDFGTIAFTNSATAGNLTMFTNNGGITEFLDTSSASNGTFINNGGIFFFGTSTAGNGTFVDNGCAVSGSYAGLIDFFDASTAENGTFVNNGGMASDACGGTIEFVGASTAGNGTFTNNGGAVSGAFGGVTVFGQTSTAGNATLIANGGLNGGTGGSIEFLAFSTAGTGTGGTARLEVFGNGHLDISSPLSNPPGITVGSIEGDGDVFLGARNLSVGSNGLSTLFSGVMQNGGGHYGGTGGSLTKIGTGKLVLSHRNTYTGGTTVKRGRLIVNNIGESGTGSGPVQVNGGRLGGKGTIAGAVTVGSGLGREAVLSPGYHHSHNPGTLTIQSPLIFNSDGTYEIEVNSSSETVDKVVALGVTINVGAQTLFADLGNGTFTVGNVFTVIDNTSATPIAGTFSNLPDGSMFTANGNTYEVNYEGGDGNDLTLTVVP
jgi:autotransporter-associated beta strand protein